ncbi:hypothetical protein L249_4239 [Ophiocordyceps polyrhachis-furcata BCC 54312]|uniref:Uncharacterized protein n=1 Tax=Ophiocordyceps polyrhachis-furcata BCC 54312 TaxID=1330021 RepID=A0A367L8A5_9HYPO|nr:hypothetical protein L249_4239 [Ophiocordyceps polyrhachis-furcata BCC 54312]
MLTRRLIVLLKKARLACSLTYPTFLPSYGPYGPYGPSVTYGGLGPATAGPASRDPPRPSGRVPSASYVVVPFLPLLCDVRRPRAGYGRPGVTVWRSRQTS